MIVPSSTELEVRTPDDDVWPAFSIYINHRTDPPEAHVDPAPPPGSFVQRVHHQYMGGAVVELCETICQVDG